VRTTIHLVQIFSHNQEAEEKRLDSKWVHWLQSHLYPVIIQLA